MIPPTVIQIRRELCHCEGVNHADPCAACPNGHFGRYEQTGCDDGTQKIGLGDIVSAVATPIARIIGSDCIDKETNQPKPESPCGKAKERLNAGEPIFQTIIKRLKRQ
jgi:hypothetical protein